MSKCAFTMNITYDLQLLYDDNTSNIVKLHKLKEGVFTLLLNDVWTGLTISDMDNIIDMFQKAKDQG